MSGVNRQVLLSCLRQDLPSDTFADKNSPFSCPKEVAVTTLLGSVFKKFEDPNPEADAKAISKFLSVNMRAGAWKLEVDRLQLWEEELLGSVKSYLDDFFHPAGEYLVPSFEALFFKGELGPGANLMGRGGDFYTKMFSSVLTTTSLELYKSYRRSVANLPSWSIAENNRLRTVGGPRIVEGSRISCVPKNVDISRTICTEPTLNMWYQLAVGNLIRERLSRFFGIDLENVAEVNRDLARRGSLVSGGDCVGEQYSEEYCTIDLESASDSMSLGMLKLMLPQWVYELLMFLRSPVTRMPDGSRVELQMVSTMGNGFTFPLQTAIFSCVVAAVYSYLGLPRQRVDTAEPNWSVFGDDIIVVRKAYGWVCRVLELLGFAVNADKSFFEGPFRESCGSDYFNGHYVRPVYIRRLSGVQDTYVAFNKLIRWASVQGFSIPNTAQYLLKRARFNPVPLWESDDAGFKVPPWWAHESKRRYTSSGAYAYKACVLKRVPIVLSDTAIVVPRSQRSRMYNPEGLLIAVARGEFRDGELTPRQRGGRVVWIRRVALNWEIPPVADLRGHLVCERLVFHESSLARMAFGHAVWPVAGHAEGGRWKTDLYRTLEYSVL